MFVCVSIVFSAGKRRIDLAAPSEAPVEGAGCVLTEKTLYIGTKECDQTLYKVIGKHIVYRKALGKGFCKKEVALLEQVVLAERARPHEQQRLETDMRCERATGCFSID